MYHDIEEQLKQNFNSLNPDLFSAIKDNYIPKIDSEEELFSEMPCSSTHIASRRNHFVTYISAAVFLCIITTFLYMNRSTAVGMIVVEASSSVTLSVDQYNKIIDVTSNNSEDEKSYSVYKGKDLSNGLENIFSDIEQKSLHTVTDIKVTYHTIKPCEVTKKKLRETVDHFSKKEGVYVEADYQSTGSSEYVEVEDNTENSSEDIVKEDTNEQETGTETITTISDETDSSIEDPFDDISDSTSETDILEEQPEDSDQPSSIDSIPEESQDQNHENDQMMDNEEQSYDETNKDIIDENQDSTQSDVDINNVEKNVDVEMTKIE